MSAIEKLTRLVELQARIVGQLRDTKINLTNIQIDTETAERMAKMFLARKGAAAPKSEMVPSLAPPSTVTVDVAADYESSAAVDAPASNVGSV